MDKKVAPKREKSVSPKIGAMDMNTAFYLRKEDNKTQQWRIIDANGYVLGRLATEVADILRGKDKPYYTPHTDSGDYVVVINADKVVLTGKKWDEKEMAHYTGWIGGLKITTPRALIKKHPGELVTLAVKGMLPKNKLSRQLMRKLMVYGDNKHPHTAQRPVVHTLKAD